jgi:hypothetical protein
VPALTRRRDTDARHDACLIYYGDMHVSTIAIRLQADGNRSMENARDWTGRQASQRHLAFLPAEASLRLAAKLGRIVVARGVVLVDWRPRRRVGPTRNGGEA